MQLISKESLRILRNEVKIELLIKNTLVIEYKYRDNYLRFICPICKDYHTAINHQHNLARCFRCKKNFNPIDLTMEYRRWDFKTAVAFLKNIFCQSG